MSTHEVGRMILNSTSLIEYESNNVLSYFIQSGVVGFYATSSELADLYSVINYYYNIDNINNTVVSLLKSEDNFLEDNDELAV